MKIGYVSQEDPFHDRKAWSGTIFKVREAIEDAGFAIEWVRVKPPKYILQIVKGILKIRYGFTQNHPLIFKILAKYTDWNKAKECDILFFSGNAQIMKYSPIKKSFIYYSDAHFNQMIDYYWYNVNKKFIKLANVEELWALQHASINIHSSDWARNCAIDFYNRAPNNNFVLEFGANIDRQDINIYGSRNNKADQFNILFSGVDWERKGGDLAVETVKILREQFGIMAKLYIVGIRKLPNSIEKLDYIINLGFLNKNITEEYNKYIEIIKKCCILLLPTKAECSAIVFCEASAYGLPIYTHDTGGIANYVENGVNGYRLQLGSTAYDFAAKIYTSIASGELSILHEGALKLYSDKLNWKSWSVKFKNIVYNNHI